MVFLGTEEQEPRMEEFTQSGSTAKNTRIPNDDGENEDEYEYDDGNEDDKDDDEDYPTLSDIDNPAELTVASIGFFEDTSRGATLRTRNVPADQKQRYTVTSRGARSLRYKSTVALTSVVHGFLDADASPRIPATLVVLSYRLNGLKKGKPNYAAVYTELEFASIRPVAPVQEPFVRAFAPLEEHQGLDQESWREEQVKTAYKLGALELDVGVGSGKIEGKVGQERQRKERKRFFQLFQASYASVKSGMDGYDSVWWDLRQNEDSKEGVPPVFSTAVLVQRSDEKSEFKARFVMALETGVWTRAKSKADRWFGITKDDPIRFDPSMEERGCPAGVDRDKLGKLMEKGNLSGLGGFKNLADLGKKNA